MEEAFTEMSPPVLYSQRRRCKKTKKKPTPTIPLDKQENRRPVLKEGLEEVGLLCLVGQRAEGEEVVLVREEGMSLLQGLWLLFDISIACPKAHQGFSLHHYSALKNFI